MLHRVYSIRDLKAEYYNRPFFARSEGEAIRIFVESAKDNLLDRYPDDFKLFFIGTFDDNRAELDAVGPVSIGTVSEVRVMVDVNHKAMLKEERRKKKEEDSFELISEDLEGDPRI